jgi:hypothetical protein
MAELARSRVRYNRYTRLRLDPLAQHRMGAEVGATQRESTMLWNRFQAIVGHRRQYHFENRVPITTEMYEGVRKELYRTMLERYHKDRKLRTPTRIVQKMLSDWEASPASGLLCTLVKAFQAERHGNSNHYYPPQPVVEIPESAPEELPELPPIIDVLPLPMPELQDIGSPVKSNHWFDSPNKPEKPQFTPLNFAHVSFLEEEDDRIMRELATPMFPDLFDLVVV